MGRNKTFKELDEVSPGIADKLKAQEKKEVDKAKKPAYVPPDKRNQSFGESRDAPNP